MGGNFVVHLRILPIVKLSLSPPIILLISIESVIISLLFLTLVICVSLFFLWLTELNFCFLFSWLNRLYGFLFNDFHSSFSFFQCILGFICPFYPSSLRLALVICFRSFLFPNVSIYSCFFSSYHCFSHTP